MSLAGSLAGSLQAKVAGSLAGDSAHDEFEAIFGLTYALGYRGQDYTPGGSGIAAAPNLASSGYADVDQATDSQRPTPVGVSGYPAWRFLAASAQSLFTTGLSPDVAAIGESLSVTMAIRDNGATSGWLFQLSDGTNGSGIFVRRESGILKSNIVTASAGTRSLTRALTDTASIHIVQSILTAGNTSLRIDDSLTTSSTTTGGLADGLDAVHFGNSPDLTAPYDGDLLHTVVAIGETVDQDADALAAMALRYGVAL